MPEWFSQLRICFQLRSWDQVLHLVPCSAKSLFLPLLATSPTCAPSLWQVNKKILKKRNSMPPLGFTVLYVTIFFFILRNEEIEIKFYFGFNIKTEKGSTFWGNIIIVFFMLIRIVWNNFISFVKILIVCLRKREWTWVRGRGRGRRTSKLPAEQGALSRPQT